MQTLTEAKVTLSVFHTVPLQIGPNLFAASFWLSLRVDNGSSVGIGKSEEHPVDYPAESRHHAYKVGFDICAIAQRRVEKLDLIQALIEFPTIIDDLASTEEN